MRSCLHCSAANTRYSLLSLSASDSNGRHLPAGRLVLRSMRPSLRMLRRRLAETSVLYRDDTEEPYLHPPGGNPTGSWSRTMRATLINAGIREEASSVFDAEMPLGSYDVVDLSLTAQNFVATVTVRGSQTQDGAPTQDWFLHHLRSDTTKAGTRHNVDAAVVGLPLSPLCPVRTCSNRKACTGSSHLPRQRRKSRATFEVDPGWPCE